MFCLLRAVITGISTPASHAIMIDFRKYNTSSAFSVSLKEAYPRIGF